MGAAAASWGCMGDSHRVQTLHALCDNSRGGSSVLTLSAVHYAGPNNDFAGCQHCVIAQSQHALVGVDFEWPMHEFLIEIL